MNEFTKDSPTSEKLVAELGTKTDITISADIVHGLDYEYKHLQQKNQELKGQLELYENGVYYFSELDRKDKEIDKLNKQLGEWEKHLINAKEMLELQGHNGNYNYDSYMLGLYNGMEYIIALFETREPNFKNGKDIEFLNDKNKNQNQELKNLNRIYEEIISDDEENYKLLSSEIKQLKNQQKEFIDWLENESKEIIRDAGYHQRICLDILEKYKEIIGDKK